MKWQVQKPLTEKQLERFPQYNQLVLQLLFNRGLKDQAAIDEFLQPDYLQDIHDPYLFSQMQLAVDLIVKAISENKKIALYGDYDADGITGTAILATFFNNQNIDVISYIPHREIEGYGLNKKAIDILAKKGVDLIITIDCGISNAPEIEYAGEKYNMETIITDHHEVPADLPPANAIIHTNIPDETYPFKALSGGGTAFKLAQALLASKFFSLTTHQREKQEKWLLDLVAISTVGDIMPLLGENRTLVKYGLIVLQKNKRLGLQKLMEICNISTDSFDTQKIGWQIVPRLNAVGRISHSQEALQLLLTEHIEEALALARSLNQVNTDRQKVTEQVMLASCKMLNVEKGPVKKQILIAQGKGWAPGVLGLVAGKLVTKYNRPALVVTERGSEIIGSGRSIDGFNIIEALTKHKDLFVRFGGHPAACGFTIKQKNWDKFVKLITKDSQKTLQSIDLDQIVDIDSEIKLADCNWELIDIINDFSPYGEKNPEPIFLTKKVKLISWQTVGNEDKHLRLVVEQSNVVRKAIAFNMGNIADSLKIGQIVDIVFQFSVNQWNGNRELQLKIIDLKLNNKK